MDELLAALDGATEVAVDTEADSFYRYKDSVCLLQITVNGRDFLVDPLAEVDVAALGPMLADPKVTKVFHDGEYDVLILRRDFAFRFANLFDTKIAASALGVEAPGLGSVIEARLGFTLDKSQQRSNWSKRPLTPKQIRYAQLDTHYLIRLMGILIPDLEAKGRMPIVEGECHRLEGLAAPVREFQPDEFVRLKGARTLDMHQAQLLRELFILRNALAEQRDVPPFKVLGNQALVEIARQRPRSLRALEGVPGFSPKLAHRLGEEILSTAKRARALGPLGAFPRLPAKDGTSVLDDAGYEMHERLKEWRKERARDEELDSSLVLNRHTLLHLADTRPRNLANLAGTNGILPWQVEAYGDELIDLINDFEDDLSAGRIQLGPRGRRNRRSRKG